MLKSIEFIGKWFLFSSRENLPSNTDIRNIHSYIQKIDKIVKVWNKDAYLRPFGSISNGFLLKDWSDIDLTIVYAEKADWYPSEYISDLKELLLVNTETVWSEIKTHNLYLLSCDSKEGYEVEILLNNITGLANSEYIRTLAEYDIRFHKLGYYIKYFVSNNEIFTKKNKLNSFSLMWMLIVYLQDIVSPPVLPRIIDSDSNEIISGFYT